MAVRGHVGDCQVSVGYGMVQGRQVVWGLGYLWCAPGVLIRPGVVASLRGSYLCLGRQTWDGWLLVGRFVHVVLLTDVGRSRVDL